MDFKTTITQLRERADASQQDVADAIGIARATYAGLEAGRREPDLAEIKALAEYYQIAPSDLIEGKIGSVDEDITPHLFEPREPDVTPRDLHPKTNPEKLREVLLYVLEKVGAKSNVGETVLYKLLYFIDFDYYEKYGKSITGLAYVRNHYGPTPVKTFAEIVEGMQQAGELEIVTTKFFNNKQKKYLPTAKPDLQELSAIEIKHIDEELARLSDKNASELSDLSHKDTPWRVAKPGKPIEYRYVFYRTDQTAVTEPEDEL